MIRVERGPEPSAVTVQRARRLAIACEAFNEFGPGSDELKATLTDYDAGKRALYLRQHRKCAYCERKPGYANQPVEHYRPKANAWRHLPGDGVRDVDRERYWWLTWNWDNQLFACTHCNGPGTKGNYFPLAKETLPTPAPARPCGEDVPPVAPSESPLLLDPSDENIDPFKHLQWAVEDPELAPKRWTWRLDGLTPEGRVTRRILQLHESEDEVNDHYKTSVWPFFVQVQEALPANKGRAREAWFRLCQLVDPELFFTAATWWQVEALRCWVGREYGLHFDAMAKPGASARAPG